MQLKSDILNEAVGRFSVATSSDDPNNLEESSDPLEAPPTGPLEAPPTNMLDILLNGIGGGGGGGMTTPNDQVSTAATAQQVCENEMYQLLLGNDFKMNMQNIEKTAYNCPLSWWKSSAHRFKNLESLAVKHLAIPATSAPSERIWSRAARVLTVKRNRMSEEVTSAMMYCRENRELLHKYYAEIARERMHPDDHHLIMRRQALLPTFENEEDADSKIDVGVDEDKEL
jgi:hypothetical protein